MSSEQHKVTAGHLARNAYLHVRQSTLRQVTENTESTHRQYELRNRAHALGWPVENVIVIDCRISPTYHPNFSQSSRSISLNVATQCHHGSHPERSDAIRPCWASWSPLLFRV